MSEYRTHQTAGEPMTNNAEGFRITSGKGFHITFPNGWSVSVQFGPYNYCANRINGLVDVNEFEGAQQKAGEDGSATAETAVWGPNGNLLEVAWCNGDTVQGWQTPSDVLRLLNLAASQPATVEAAS